MTFSSGLRIQVSQVGKLSNGCNNHVLMEEVKNIGKVAGCLIVFLKEKSQSIIINLKIFVIHWLTGVYNK